MVLVSASARAYVTTDDVVLVDPDASSVPDALSRLQSTKKQDVTPELSHGCAESGSVLAASKPMNIDRLLGLAALAAACSACGARGGDVDHESSSVAAPPAQSDPRGATAAGTVVATQSSSPASSQALLCGGEARPGAICPSVLDDGSPSALCAPSRAVFVRSCCPYTILSVREGIDVSDRCYYDAGGRLTAALHTVNVRTTCTFGPPEFTPPECSDDAPISDNYCAPPSTDSNR